MSYFGTALEELLNRKNMKAAKLSELSGVGQPAISRIINDERQSVSGEDLAALAGAISEDPTEQAALIVARLRDVLDERRAPGSELVEITVRGEKISEDAPVYKIKLPPQGEADFETLRQWFIRDKNVRETVQGLAKLLREGTCRID